MMIYCWIKSSIWLVLRNDFTHTPHQETGDRFWLAMTHTPHSHDTRYRRPVWVSFPHNTHGTDHPHHHGTRHDTFGISVCPRQNSEDTNNIRIRDCSSQRWSPCHGFLHWVLSHPLPRKVFGERIEKGECKDRKTNFHLSNPCLNAVSVSAT